MYIYTFLDGYELVGDILSNEEIDRLVAEHGCIREMMPTKFVNYN